MSLPYVQKPPVPAMGVSNQHGGSSSAGPVIAVLAVIMVLGVISAMIGRLCAGSRIPGIGQYDLEGWFGTKFRPCIDGRMGAHVQDGGGGVPIVIPVEKAEDMKQSTGPHEVYEVAE